MSEFVALSERPTDSEYADYYGGYIGQVPGYQCAALLESQVTELKKFFESVSEADATIVHPPYRWTIKQVVGHMIDAERIFADRLHRFSSGDPQSQPGMDQDLYVTNHDYESPTLAVLVEEFLYCRRANLLLIQRLRPKAFDLRGTASGHSFTVRALAWILVGHVIHHMKIVRKRLE